MDAFVLSMLCIATFAGVAGARALAFRESILRFARGQYEKIYRADGMREDELENRLPRMGAVVFIGIGCLAVATIAAAALWVSMWGY